MKCRRMIKNMKFRYKKKKRDYSFDMLIDFKPLDGKLGRAQYILDSNVMTSMVPFMPKETGTFINVTQLMSQAIAGSGKVYASAPPFGRYLYNGKVMVDPVTGSPWARPGVKKVVTSKEINFSKAANLRVVPFWFDEAKKMYSKIWINKAKDAVGGNNG